MDTSWAPAWLTRSNARSRRLLTGSSSFSIWLDPVRIVTDHGWLLLPGDLPKIELPPSLVVKKGHRAAAVKGDSTVNCRLTLGIGIPGGCRVTAGNRVFYADIEYAHAGDASGMRSSGHYR